MTRRIFGGFCLALLCFLAIGGCGGAGPVKTSAYVTLDGAPLEGAMVEFLPVDSKVGQPAMGQTGSDGIASLTTRDTGDGVVPGEYKVTVVKKEHLKSSMTETGTTDPSAAIKGAYGNFAKEKMSKKDKGKSAEPKSEIPASYSDPQKTPFKFTVPVPGGKVELPIKK